MRDLKNVTWCPGCGNFPIIKTAEAVLAEDLALSPREYVVVGGIGQAAKLPHYLSRSNGFSGLHGRSVPNAIGIKLANHELEVLLFSGDGDLLAEGGNHFLHAVRRNIGINLFLHDNQVYGLTKGQASPTAWQGMTTTINYGGVTSTPLDAMRLGLAAGAKFAARTSMSDMGHLRETMVEALRYDGFSLVQIMQTCPSFNKERNIKWYRKNTSLLPENHDETDLEAALRATLDPALKLGIFYRVPGVPYEKSHPVLAGQDTLVNRGLEFKFTDEDLMGIL
jgi:2-oxoglutarate/2-oxoacid ferredoxin oxidoreductase subunit beta